MFMGKGCAVCHDTGYKGRVGVYELLSIDHNIQDMFSDNAPIAKMRSYAHGSGFQSLLHDGLSKVAQGTTSLEEVIRSLPYRYIHELVDG